MYLNGLMQLVTTTLDNVGERRKPHVLTLTLSDLGTACSFSLECSDPLSFTCSCL